jgi:hypothetical protein
MTIWQRQTFWWAGILVRQRRKKGRSSMIDQPRFDRFRRTCAARLKQFITEANQTERYAQNLSLPASVQEVRTLMTKRQAEYDACYEYLLASRKLADFLQQQVQSIQ